MVPSQGHRLERFIPARAGNSAEFVAVPGMKTVHPRACGELPALHLREDPNRGSSPRVRGTRADNTIEYPRRRFIPARAGNL